VDYAISLLAAEMSRTMALLGCRTVAQLSRAHLTRA
jgi:isopentenyl diphosphate isomerase/L-lactate dehydrogenase-like FMN-dependent dehydrogenase